MGLSGTQTATLGFGGYLPGATALAAVYDGTSWATSPSMGTGRGGSGAGGTGGGITSGFAAGGYTTTRVATTEEFTGETTALNVENITDS